MSVTTKTLTMLAASQSPAVGGVETHLSQVTEIFRNWGWQVEVLTPPTARPSGKIGLIWLWIWVLKNRRVFLAADIIQIHDVFLWFWPLWPLVKIQQFFTGRPVKIVTTFHGWEGTFPPTTWQRFNKWLAQAASTATVAVGDFIEKFYPIKPSLVVYGGVAKVEPIMTKKTSSTWIYLGRLANDTGLPMLLESVNPKVNQLEFWGDGPLIKKCQKLGLTRGWVNQPLRELSLLPVQPQGVIAGGYLAVLEALSLGLRVMVIADNPLKQAYYQLAPFAKYLIITTTASEIKSGLMVPNNQTLQAQAQEIRENNTWDNLAAQYLKLYEA